MYFPGRFSNGLQREYASKLKYKVLLELSEIITDKDEKEKIEKAYRELMTMAKPMNFSGAEGAEVRHIKTFEELCYLINTENSNPAKSMTTLEFFSALGLIKKKYKKNANKPH